MSEIKAVIFDMDGVLIDAKEWHYEALNRALALFGYEISRYDHLVTYDGLPTSKKLEMLSMERGMPRRLHKFINELKQQYTVDKIFTDCRPVFAHEYALAKLREDGYHIAVASNSVRHTIELMMEKSNLLPYLPEQSGCGEGETGSGDLPDGSQPSGAVAAGVHGGGGQPQRDSGRQERGYPCDGGQHSL